MFISLTERFQEDVQLLSDQQRDSLFSVILKLPKVFKDKHLHSGVGLRKLHASGIYEARLGLNSRLVFGFKSNEIVLHRIGSHDLVKKYLKQL